MRCCDAPAGEEYNAFGGMTDWLAFDSRFLPRLDSSSVYNGTTMGKTDPIYLLVGEILTNEEKKKESK